jgi:hypothetical protein
MVGSRNRPWTEQDERRLLELRNSGKSYLSIAVALRRSASAVKGRLSICRARTRSIPRSLKQEAVEIHPCTLAHVGYEETPPVGAGLSPEQP